MEKRPSFDIRIDRSLVVKAVFIIVLIAFLVAVYGKNNAADINLDTVNKTLTEKTNLAKSMSKQSDRELEQFIGIEADDYDQVIYYRNTEALAVDELLIVKAGSSDDLDAVSDAVQERIDSQINTYDSYGPKQVKLLKNAITLEKGRYYFYCTSSDASEYEEVLLNAI